MRCDTAWNDVHNDAPYANVNAAAAAAAAVASVVVVLFIKIPYADRAAAACNAVWGAHCLLRARGSSSSNTVATAATAAAATEAAAKQGATDYTYYIYII